MRVHQCPNCKRLLGWVMPEPGERSEVLEVQCVPLVGGCGWTGFLSVSVAEVNTRWERIAGLVA
jgi:hypothetical protein